MKRQFHFRLTGKEYKFIKQQADAQGITMSEYIRRLISDDMRTTRQVIRTTAQVNDRYGDEGTNPRENG